MHINLNFNFQFGGTNTTNHANVANSPNAVVTLPSPPQRPATSTNWEVAVVQAFAALATAAKVLAPYLGLLLGG